MNQTGVYDFTEKYDKVFDNQIVKVSVQPNSSQILVFDQSKGVFIQSFQNNKLITIYQSDSQWCTGITQSLNYFDGGIFRSDDLFNLQI